MYSLCSIELFHDWKGDTGNITMFVGFLTAFAINLFASSFFYIRDRGKFSLGNHLISILLMGHMLVCTVFICATSMRIFSTNTISCQYTFIGYVSHQFGICTSSNALLAMTVFHYYLLASHGPLQGRQRRNLVRKMFILLIVSVIFGICLAVIPPLYKIQFTATPFIAYDVLLEIILIVYCIKFRIGIACVSINENSNPEYVERLRHEARLIQPATAITSVSKAFYLVLQPILQSMIVREVPTDDIIVLRWAGTIYYLSIIVLPVMFIIVRRDVKWCSCLTQVHSTIDACAIENEK